MKSTYIKSHKELTIDKKIVEYIKPQIIYIPLESKVGVKYRHLIKEGDYVYKGQVVAYNDDLNFPIHSSVSGYAINGTKKMMNNGEKIKCIVVENDFKERYEYSTGAKRIINTYSKDEFVTMLREYGITGLGGSDFPTYIKYNSNQKYEYLIINGVECEPYITADESLMMEHAEDILECIDAIIEIMHLKKAIIGIKNTNTKIIEEFLKYKGTYPNITIYGVIDAYPNGWERNLISNILGINYEKYPTEKGILVNNVSTIYAIYEMLKYNRPLTERIITITGDKIKNPQNVKVKIGASVKEILMHLDGYKELKNPLFIAGGPMMGQSLPTDDLVITKDLNCVIVVEDTYTLPKACIKCGKCIEVCPVNIMPVLIKENINNEKALEKLTPKKCIECGLCSYICPSRIEVREYVRKAKTRVVK